MSGVLMRQKGGRNGYRLLERLRSGLPSTNACTIWQCVWWLLCLHRCRVLHRQVTDSTVANGSVIGTRAVVEGSILETGCTLGPGTQRALVSPCGTVHATTAGPFVLRCWALPSPAGTTVQSQTVAESVVMYPPTNSQRVRLIPPSARCLSVLSAPASMAKPIAIAIPSAANAPKRVGCGPRGSARRIHAAAAGARQG
jgi:NDP-sugar pyrophosphorylase family protein